MKKKSIRNKLVLQILLILVPLLLSNNLNNFHMASTLRDQTSRSSLDIVSLYMHQIDTSLTDSYSWLINQSGDTAQLMKINSTDETQRIYANISLFNNFRELLNIYPVLDTVFVYTPKYNNIVSASSEKITYSEKKMLWGYMESLPTNRNNVDANWKITAINGEKYFFNIKSFDGGYLGIMTKPETLEGILLQNKSDSGSFIFADNNGEPLSDMELTQELGLDLSKDLSTYYMTGKPEKQLIVGEESTVADFRLLMVIPDKKILEDISWVYIQSYVLMIASMAAFVGIIISIYKEVLRPINHIVEAIHHVGQDNFTLGITPKGEAWEYTAIYNAFNQMLKQIETLKIDNYEEHIKRQQAELHFYQMQIKPHFILSCLTTISNLAKLGEKEKLVSFISDFSNFSRYLFHTEFTLRLIEDELSQIEYYINMQKIRFSEKIFLMTDVPDTCYTRQIPAMILQTLVENCVKHGMDPNSDLCIFIQCREVCSGEDKSLVLIVEDTGNGFSSVALAEINGSSFAAGFSKGFGLRNVKATLHLNYNGKANICFKNIEPKGARVEIKLPQTISID